MTVEPLQEELDDLSVRVVLGEVPVGEFLVGKVSVGLLLDGSGVGTLSFPMVIVGQDGKGGGVGGG